MSAAKYNTNLASEFYAMSVLYRLGCDAHLTLGNKKAVDIVVVRGPGDVVTLDVKAVVGKTDWLAGSPEAVARGNHFVALSTVQDMLLTTTTCAGSSGCRLYPAMC